MTYVPRFFQLKCVDLTIKRTSYSIPLRLELHVQVSERVGGISYVRAE